MELSLPLLTVTLWIGTRIGFRIGLRARRRPLPLLNTLRCTCGDTTNAHTDYFGACHDCDCRGFIAAIDHPYGLDAVEQQLGWTSPPLNPAPTRADLQIMLALGFTGSEWAELDDPERDYYRAVAGTGRLPLED